MKGKFVDPFSLIVPGAGLEPAHREVAAPKAAASTNSASRAHDDEGYPKAPLWRYLRFAWRSWRSQ